MREVTEAKCRRIQSPFKMSLIFFVLNEIHRLLVRDKTCTVR